MWKMTIFKTSGTEAPVEEQIILFLNVENLSPEKVKILAHFSPGGERMWKAVVYYYEVLKAKDP